MLLDHRAAGFDPIEQMESLLAMMIYCDYNLVPHKIVSLVVYNSNIFIWWFPEIGVPPNHPFLDGIFPYKPTILGYPHLWKPPYRFIKQHI